MSELDRQDDATWEYVLATKLMPYLPSVRDWWNNVEDILITGTGVFPVKGDNVPPGLMYRMTNTPVRSPIKHIQVFPFVPVNYLQLSNVAGGANRMITRVCADNFTLEEFTIISKSNLPSTYHQGQIIAFVPTQKLNAVSELGKWIYLTKAEQLALVNDKVLQSVKLKMVKH